jgi:cell division protein FtsN
MSREENGEFEIVLGNKQLLSIFVIVVILLGVFFTMGYTLGKNSRGAQTAAVTSKEPAQTSGQPSVQPQHAESPFGSPVAPQQANEVQQPAPPEAPLSKPQPEPQKPPAQPEQSVTKEPSPGETYLQVAAVKQPEAEVIAEVLRKKGFPAIIARHPELTLYRVLVGPLANAAEVAKTRSALLDLNAGFKPIVRKY